MLGMPRTEIEFEFNMVFFFGIRLLLPVYANSVEIALSDLYLHCLPRSYLLNIGTTQV